LATGTERRSTAIPEHLDIMSSFIAIADTTVPAQPANATIVRNDGWFPDINLKDLREAMRLDGTVTLERLRLATVDAIASINDELRAWKAGRCAQGHADLASVPADQTDGVSAHVLRYRRAVYNLTRADLTEQYRAYDVTKTGANDTEVLEATICESRRNVRWALNDMRGVPRSTIELI